MEAAASTAAAIVGASADIAVGAALFKKVNQKPGLVICNIGDASMSCGPVWEAICFATMDQFKTLWTGAQRGGLPQPLEVVHAAAAEIIEVTLRKDADAREGPVSGHGAGSCGSGRAMRV